MTHTQALLLVCAALLLLAVVCFMCWWLPRYVAEGYQSDKDGHFHYGKEPEQ